MGCGRRDRMCKDMVTAVQSVRDPRGRAVIPAPKPRRTVGECPEGGSCDGQGAGRQGSGGREGAQHIYPGK